MAALSVSLFTLSVLSASAQDTVDLTSGMVITRSVVVRPGEYRLRPAASDSAVIRVRGSGITLDLSAAALIGTPEDAPPDQASGIGILIEGGRGVTVQGGRIRGYKIGLLARGVRNLRLHDLDLSHNWKPRLWSGLGHESLVDWLYFHHNEQDEWLRYGAGIFLIDVRGGEIRGNRARQGMNGLQTVRTERLRIWDNDFSYLSGLGIGLYRSSHNTIMHNRLDYCVRGYVHGGYRRGQDSASLLLYEQSSHNVVAYNTMTHSGDGVFLWAGQSTMDSGQGGANDNLFFGNDVSYAVANGIEATFSRNRFIGNLSEGSEYGLWGGYSWGSEIRDNLFKNNVTGIAIEHGQDNVIAGNGFFRDRTAIRLWWNRLEPSDWGYPKRRDTRSRNYRLERNFFAGNAVAVRLEDTQHARLEGNVFSLVDTVLRAAGDTSGYLDAGSERHRSGLTGHLPWKPDLGHRAAPRPLTRGADLIPPAVSPRGRETILVDEWGPYDRRSPKLWPATPADSAYAAGPLRLQVLGPAGAWRLVGSRGVAAVSDSAGRVGDTITVSPAPAAITDWEVTLEYTGGEVTAPTGRLTPAGAPYRFTYSRFVAAVHWAVRVAAWDSTSDPRTDTAAFRRRLLEPAAATLRETVLDWMFFRPRRPGIPAERFGVLAEGAVDLPPGRYELVTISDDGIRVWVDDQLVIDRWVPHESELATAPIAAGRRRLRVEYYQVGGWTELRVEVGKTH